MKQLQLKTVLIIGLFSLFSFSANAAFIDQGTSVLDTDTGLEWLKLTATDGRSASAAITANAANGWQVANESQYETMFDAMFPTYSDPAAMGFRSVYAGEVLFDQAVMFQALFGTTHDNTAQTGAYGFYDMGNGNYAIGGIFGGKSPAFYNLYRDRVGLYDANYSIAASGVFMVRSVPEASTLAMLAIGILGIGFARRRKA